MIVTKGNMLYEGKANTVYETDSPYLLIFESTDRISTDDCTKKDVVKGKGLSNSKISTALFKLFASHDVPTHYVDEGPNEYSKIVRKAEMIKLEAIGRFVAAGSFCKRYGVEYGKKFGTMVFELAYKNDALGDPFISKTAALYGLNLVKSESILNDIEDYTYVIGMLAQDFFDEFDLTLVDFKIEFGFDIQTRELLLCDEFSLDTCRLWDIDGKSLDKDVFRKGLGNVYETYKKALEILQI